MNKIVSIIVLIVCSLGATMAWAQYLNIGNMQKNTFCAQARRAFGMVYYELCDALGYEGYSLEKMRTIVNNARNKHGKCIESYYPTFVISALKQTTDIYCEKGNVYVGFAKQNNLKAYEKAFEAEGKAIQKEQERKAAAEAAEYAKALRKADSIEQAKIQAAIIKSSFIDSRDGKKYKTVPIGSQTWMAENLNYNANSSKCYDNKTANCNKYGKLYDWTTANKACPVGWHLPSNDEWDKLYSFIDSLKGTEKSTRSLIENPYIKSPYTSTTAGKYLKSNSGWKENDNGNDNFGFTALPGGACSGGRCSSIGNSGLWWSSSASEINADVAYYRSVYNNLDNADGAVEYKTTLFSVRCLQDSDDNNDTEQKSALVGIWGGKVGECNYGTMEFLNDGSVGDMSAKWKAENDRLYIYQLDTTIVYNYKISDSILTLTNNEKSMELKKITVKDAATAFEVSIARNAAYVWNRLQAAYYTATNKVGDFNAIAFNPPRHLYFSYKGNIKDGIAYLIIKNGVKINDCQAGNEWSVLMTKDNDLKVQLPKDISCKEVIPCFDSQGFDR